MFCTNCSLSKDDDRSCESCQVGNSETPAVKVYFVEGAE